MTEAVLEGMNQILREKKKVLYLRRLEVVSLDHVAEHNEHGERQDSGDHLTRIDGHFCSSDPLNLRLSDHSTQVSAKPLAEEREE